VSVPVSVAAGGGRTQVLPTRTARRRRELDGMATTSPLRRSPGSGPRRRPASTTRTPTAVTRPCRRCRAASGPLVDLRAPLVVPRPRAAGRRPAVSASLTSLRWAFAFYGAFVFIPVAMAAASCFGP
jgi:hypothetical protein